tara:strand:+ start:102 stop:1304 length:1203 start_codon:yes stop_codon:yes gene_type:complete
MTTSSAAYTEEMGDNEGLWNKPSLLQWAATIGDEKSLYDDLESVKNFELLQQSIEEVKQMVLHDARSEREAIEGLRMILKHLASSTTDWMKPDFKNPLRLKHDSRNRDIGAYNPDAEYDQALIDGHYDYKLSGTLGTVPYVSITVSGPVNGKFSEVIAYLNDEAIRKHVGTDNKFTLWLSKKKPTGTGAWVSLPDEANSVVIRQYVANREHNTLASFTIESVGASQPDIENLTDAEIASRLKRISDYLLISSTWHRTLLPEMKNTPNQFVSSTGDAIGASAANSENYYQMAYYELGEDEVLVIDLDPPDTVYWNLTSASYWHESNRYLTDPVSMTSNEVEKRKDGKVRFIISRNDPDYSNWIKTFGYNRGFLILRMVGVTSHDLPIVSRVSVAELSKYID